MPQPTSGTTIQRPDLGQLAYEYAYGSALQQFIGLQVMPLFPVAEQSADYPVIPIEAVLKLPDVNRAPKGAYNRGDWEFESGTYSTKEYGFEEPLDDSEAAKYRRFFDAETMATFRATNILLRNQEKRIADKIMNPSNFTAHAVSTKWNVYATATIRANVKAGAKAIEDATGMEPNALILSKASFEDILLNAEFLAENRYTGSVLMAPREVQKQMVSTYLGINNILIGNGAYDAANKGKAHSLTKIWPEAYGMLAVLSTNPMDLKEPCLGRTFLWEEGGAGNLITEQYREEQTRSNIYRVRHNTGEHFVFTACAYLLSNLR